MHGAGRAQLKQQPAIDVILLDLGLPDSDGVASLEWATRAAPHLPIIVLTGSEDEALGMEAVRKGAQDYLVKGQTPPRMIVRVIHHATERKRLEDSLRQAHQRLQALMNTRCPWESPSRTILPANGLRATRRHWPSSRFAPRTISPPPRRTPVQRGDGCGFSRKGAKSAMPNCRCSGPLPRRKRFRLWSSRSNFPAVGAGMPARRQPRFSTSRATWSGAWPCA